MRRTPRSPRRATEAIALTTLRTCRNRPAPVIVLHRHVLQKLERHALLNRPPTRQSQVHGRLAVQKSGASRRDQSPVVLTRMFPVCRNPRAHHLMLGSRRIVHRSHLIHAAPSHLPAVQVQSPGPRESNDQQLPPSTATRSSIQKMNMKNRSDVLQDISLPSGGTAEAVPSVQFAHLREISALTPALRWTRRHPEPRDCGEPPRLLRQIFPVSAA